MPSIIQLISLVFALFSLFYTIYAVGALAVFLSPISKVSIAQTWIINFLDNKSKFQTALYAVTFDAFWVVGFILQHSLMKTTFFRKLIHNSGFALAERAIYSLASAYSLLYLINHWESAPTIVAWQFNVEDHSALWWTLNLFHLFAWIVIYGGSLIMDLPELIGIKQVYYDIKDLSPPLSYKSYNLRRLYSHVRHPSFIGLTAVLWITNCMTLDRLILATILTFYMYTAWSPDHDDVMYHKIQITKKKEELRNLGY